MVESLCAPALIFLILTVIQVLIDIFKSYYNEAFIKFISTLLICISIFMIANQQYRIKNIPID